LHGAFKLTEKSSWLVFKDNAGLGARLIERLKNEGQSVTAVVPGKGFRDLGDGLYEIDPENPGNYQTLLRQISAADLLPQQIVNLWGVTQPDEQSVNGPSPSARSTFHSLVFLAQALGGYALSSGTREQDRQPDVKIAVVTNNMQQVTGMDQIQPEKSLVLGPCQVVPQEYAGIVCQSIDVVLDQQQLTEISEQIIIELAAGRAEAVVAYRGSQRWVQGFRPVSLTDRSQVYRQDGVYLITGGLGGVGLALANDLARVE